jgi:hypothetical protein
MANYKVSMNVIKRQNVNRQGQNVAAKKQLKFKYISIWNNNNNNNNNNNSDYNNNHGSNNGGIYNGHNDNNTNNCSKIQYRICFNDRVFGPKTSTSLQTTLAADAHLAEGQFLLTEQTLNIGK